MRGLLGLFRLLRPRVRLHTAALQATCTSGLRPTRCTPAARFVALSGRRRGQALFFARDSINKARATVGPEQLARRRRQRVQGDPRPSPGKGATGSASGSAFRLGLRPSGSAFRLQARPSGFGSASGSAYQYGLVFSSTPGSVSSSGSRLEWRQAPAPDCSGVKPRLRVRHSRSQTLPRPGTEHPENPKSIRDSYGLSVDETVNFTES